jgi:2-polyprenyl-6-methoxyphenol hydroxylase-like FAD-dependent oxidoreductase
VSYRWKGHAYLLSEAPGRQVVDDGVLLVGDAAGLAYPQSGEGIRPAIESGLIAASTIIQAHNRYSRSRLRPYEDQLRDRFGIGRGSSFMSRVLPRTLGPVLGPWLVRTPFFVRHVLINRWFLHAHEPALALS